ncbi:HPBP1 protein, partial [Irena cyanogastra]|nr:HPBP1 protein [Irena cyanogastra]
QRQQWLREALSEAVSGPGAARAELRRCLRVLAGPCPGEAAAERGPGDTGGHEGALAELAELCESLDVATGLVRAQPEGLQQLEALGGLEVLGGALQSPQPPLRARAAFLLHCLLREHPRLKGLVRAQPEGLQQLEALGGLEVLGGALQSPQPPLRARAAFLLHCLLREHPRLK